MDERTQNRIFAALGVGSVVLNLGGLAISTAAGQSVTTIGSTPAHIAHALAQTAGTGVWVGAYLGVLSVGCFLAFAAWACARLGGGLLAQIARGGAVAYVSVTLASFAVVDTVLYRGGKGMSLDLGTALTTLEEALYVCSWFCAAFFLLAAGALALQWLDYQRLARAHTGEIYVFLIALGFLAVGIYVGARVAGGARPVPFDGNPKALESLGISPRELEVLREIAAGRSNKEIATQLHVSPNTVKTHAARLFEKLGAKRRTDALAKARELGIVP